MSIPSTRAAALAAALALAVTACSTQPTESLDLAGKNGGHADIQSIEFSGTGRWYQFGQAPNPGLPWPPFEVQDYRAGIDYTTASAKVSISRKQIVEPGRNRPAPTLQKIDQYLGGATAWNVAPAAPNAPSRAPVLTPQPAAAEERAAEIWTTPRGFVKAAIEHHGEQRDVDGGTEVSFTIGGKYRYVGFLNGKHQLESVRTWIDNPVLGDTLVETRYSDYKDFGGIQFPGHISRSQGGYPVLDIDVKAVKINPAVNIRVPAEAAKAAPVQVEANPLAKGVYYLTGGTHHSVAIEQKDHIVLVEAPQNEERSLALIDKLKTLIPGKPIKYLVNTHAHFDHAGGLRTFVDAGATVVTPEPNRTYFESVWAQPHTIRPDRLALSRKPAQFETFTGKHVLTDGKRRIEIHTLAGNSHNDAFAAVYLPKEKILVEADAYTPTAANVPPPASPNPYSVNLFDNIRKLKLKVDKIAALHGPRVATLNDLQAAIGLETSAR